MSELVRCPDGKEHQSTFSIETNAKLNTEPRKVSASDFDETEIC